VTEGTRYIVWYSAYRYNDGSANNAEIRREVQVGSEDEALKLVSRINKSAQGYSARCSGEDIDQDSEEEAKYEDTEDYLIDWLIGGACGGFFHPGAKAFIERYSRDPLISDAAAEVTP
jgi:hypothetical protein